MGIVIFSAIRGRHIIEAISWGLIAAITVNVAFGLAQTCDWFTPAMVVAPIKAWPWVFHGWLLVAVFLFAAWTGFGREYTTDRVSKGGAAL